MQKKWGPFFECKIQTIYFYKLSKLPDTQFACDTVAKDSGTIITNNKRNMLSAPPFHASCKFHPLKSMTKIYKTNGHVEHLTSFLFCLS